MAEKSSPLSSFCPAEVLRKHYAKLLTAIQTPAVLAANLYAEGLIGFEINQRVTSDNGSFIDRSNTLLMAVQSNLLASSDSKSVMLSLCTALENTGEPAVTEIAADMRTRITGVDPSQLTTFIAASKAPPTQSRDHLQCSAGTSGHTPVCSSPSAPLTPLDIYVRFLRTTYHSQRMPIYLKPAISHGAKTFINLALVHREKETRSKREESIMSQIRGNVDEIKKKKSPLELKDIGWVEKYFREEIRYVWSLTRQILIEGAPGVGKTTLAWHLCHKWEEGELLQQWPVVVMLQLRDKQVREAKTLNDLFYHSKPEVRQAVVDQIEEVEGNGVLLIFDGYDELSPSQLFEDSIFTQLLERKVIPAAAIMVTSRPLATGRLPDKFKRNVDLQHIEVLGFGKQDINDYITAACEDKHEMLEAFQSYLSCHPFVYSAMYNPLHCGIITELYIMHWEKGVKGFAPKTLTEIYTLLTISYLHRHFCDHPVYSKRLEVAQQFSDLPEEVFQLLMDVGKLAAVGIEQREYIFDNVSCESMGFLRKVEDMYIGHGYTSSHSFLHLTLQEFLAALYWSHTLSLQQLEELISRPDLFPLHQFVKGMHQNKDHSSSSVMAHWPVLLFIAGLRKCRFDLKLAGALEDEERRIVPFGERKVHPSLCQYVFECQSTQLISSVFTGGRYEPDVDGMNSSLDWFVMGHSIAHSHASCLWAIKLYNSHHVEMLAEGLHYTPVDGEGGRIVKMEFDNPSDVMHTLSPHTQHLAELYLRGSLPTNAESLFASIPLHSPNVERISVGSYQEIRVHKYTLDELLPLIRILPNLEKLRSLTLCLDLDSFPDGENNLLSDSLHLCPVLTILSLAARDSETGKCSSLAISLAPLLVDKLKVLELKHFGISSRAAAALARSLQSQHCSLVTLRLEYIVIRGAPFKQLAIGMGRNTSLREVVFVESRISWPHFVALADALRENKTLKKVDLSCESRRCIGAEGIQALQKLSNYNKNLSVKLPSMFW